MIKNLDSFKNLLKAIDIICVVTNSIMDNIDKTRTLLSILKQKIHDVEYYIIANFQDRRDAALEVEKIEELLGEKTFGFSAVQKDSKERIFSIIEDIVRMSILEEGEEKHEIPKYDDIWIEIEKARILETQGERIKAAISFSKIASQFKRFYSDINLQQKGEEIDAIYYLCKAWESMAYAEGYKNPKRFLEASNHFFQASKVIHDRKLKLLALGNSEFCKVLKVGMEFEKSNQMNINKDDYLKIKAIINKVIDLYREGGFEKEAKWALATSSYFDGFVNDLKKS